MRRATFAQAALEHGAAALNRVFERYLLPVNFSSEQLHLHITYNDVDLQASPLWYDDEGRVLAAALLAIREKRGWVGGFGVAPEYRGRGLATRLIDALKDIGRARNLETMQLEVLSENVPALNLYRNAGFTVSRTLYSFKRIVEQPVRPPDFVTAAPQDFVDLPDAPPPCWQREPRTLRNGAVSTAVADAAGNYALFRYNASAAQILKLSASDPHTLDSLAHAIASTSDAESLSLILLNEPAESPICGYAKTAGWDQPFSQYEMKLQLS